MLALWLQTAGEAAQEVYSAEGLRALWDADGEAGQIDFASLARSPYFVPETTTLQEQLDAFKVKPSFVFSTPAELALSLRWIAIMAQKVDCDLAASTGVHDGPALIKQLLAGAKAIQTASSLYQKGPAHIETMLDSLKEWMQKHGFNSLDDFRGRMSQEKASNPAVYERAQFMRYFGSDKDVT